MYTPSVFQETHVPTLLEMIRSAPLGTLIVASADGLEANHLPFVYDGDDGGRGTLRAHMPLANPLSTTLSASSACLVIFHGPEGYVSPSWYATKKKHGKVVPTWNYAVVHVHGSARLVEDAGWIGAQLDRLTQQAEAGKPEPWSVSDAPASFTGKLIDALVGIEVSIERLEGKIKASQNQPVENQASILAALAGSDTDFSRLMRTTLEP